MDLSLYHVAADGSRWKETGERMVPISGEYYFDPATQEVREGPPATPVIYPLVRRVSRLEWLAVGLANLVTGGVKP